MDIWRVGVVAPCLRCLRHNENRIENVMTYWIKYWTGSRWAGSLAHNNGGLGYRDLNAVYRVLEYCRANSVCVGNIAYDYDVAGEDCDPPPPPPKERL